MRALSWQGNKLQLLDQTLLPVEKVILELDNYEEVAWAINTMQVRGAPAIGIAAAYGMVLAAQQGLTQDKSKFCLLYTSRCV